MTDFKIPKNDQKLLKECHVETFKSRGKGGQHINSTNSAIRILHIPSNTIATCQDERSQYRNKEIAVRRLHKKLMELNQKPKKRIPTKVTRASKVKRIKSKKIHSLKKALRQKPKNHE